MKTINNKNLETTLTFNLRSLVILMMEYTTNEIDKVFKSYVEGCGMAQIEFP